MKVKKAIKQAKEDKEVKKLESDGFHLGSCFTMSNGKKWTLHFFNSDQMKIINVEINDNEANIGKKDDLSKEMKPIKSKPKTALKTALKKAKENCNLKINKTICVLHKKEKLMWRIIFFSPGLSVQSFDINSQNGKIEKESNDSLINIRS